MKKILLLSTLFIGSLLMIKPAEAQFEASINIGVQPAWGPSGYNYAENYYLPDIEAYYNVPSHRFVYNDRGNWVYASSLPGRCENYDLYSGYKVVLNERDPWVHFNDHRNLYAGYRFRHDQLMIRDRDYGHGGHYNHSDYDNRRGRDRSYGRRGYDHRQDWVHDYRGRNDYRYNDYYGGHGRGRW